MSQNSPKSESEEWLVWAGENYDQLVRFCRGDEDLYNYIMDRIAGVWRCWDPDLQPIRDRYTWGSLGNYRRKYFWIRARKTKLVYTEELPEAPAPEAPMGVYDLLEGLDADTAQILKWRFCEDYSVAEISACLGVPSRKINEVIREALQQIRDTEHVAS